jgi:hypothetical protein
MTKQLVTLFLAHVSVDWAAAPCWRSSVYTVLTYKGLFLSWLLPKCNSTNLVHKFDSFLIVHPVDQSRAHGLTRHTPPTQSLFPHIGDWTQSLLGRYSTTWAASSPFCSGYFGDRVLLLPRPAWTVILLFYTFCHCWDDSHAPPGLAFSFSFF